MFVKEHANTYERLEITTRGKAKLTGKLISLSPHELRDPMWWGSGLASQIEESFYPNPKDWTLGNIYKPLHLITVRDLTWSFTERISSDPTSKAKWENILGGIDWRTLLSRYKPGLATPKDFGSHFKNILHRALLTNPHNPQASTHKCRLCGEERESILHLGTCEWLRPVFEVMRKFDKGPRWDDARRNLLGVNDMKGIPPEGTSTLHFMLWKHILIQMTAWSLNHVPPNAQQIIDRAVLRLEKRISAIQYEITCEYCTSESRGTAPNLSKARRRLEGIAEISESGQVILHSELSELLEVANL